MPPLMLAGLRFMLVAFPALFVACLAIPLRLLLGYGLTISFGQFAFCSALSAWACRRGWRRWCCRRKPFYHHSWRLRLWRTLTGQAAGVIALAIFGALVLVEGEPRRGACPTGGLYADSLVAALSWPAAIFSTKIMSQATRPPIISLVVWSALIPVLLFMFASWLIDGPQLMLASLRQIDMPDGSLAALPGVYRHPRRLWYLGPRCWGAMKPGGCGAAVAAGAGSGDGPALRCCWGRR